MASRHSSHSTLHQRNEVRATSSIFDGYDGGSKRPMAASINNGAVRQPKRSVSYGAGSSGSAYGYGGYSPGLQSQGQGQEQGRVRGQNLSRYGTPVADSSEGNDRGGMRGGGPGSAQSQSVLSELEAQNDTELDGVTAKVKLLKNISLSIGDEIRSSSALAEKMNDTFDSTQDKLRRTARRMIHMADRAGVGWKAWVSFFATVIFLFWYVWLS